MERLSIETLLRNNAYPGRGIIIGRSADAKTAVTAYFIMGRSENSRNRIFVEDGEGIRTQAFDPSRLVDPSLIIYAPVRVLGNKTIVTNGDQTDTIFQKMDSQMTFEQALRTREFEPDAPNYTPRISAVATVTEGDLSLQLSVLKCADGQGKVCARYFFEYESVQPGCGYFIHTYKCDGNPIPSFVGEPEEVILPNTARETADVLWDALNEDNKVSLWVRTVDLKTGETESLILNKNQ